MSTQVENCFCPMCDIGVLVSSKHKSILGLFFLMSWLCCLQRWLKLSVPPLGMKSFFSDLAKYIWSSSVFYLKVSGLVSMLNQSLINPKLLSQIMHMLPILLLPTNTFSKPKFLAIYLWIRPLILVPNNSLLLPLSTIPGQLWNPLALSRQNTLNCLWNPNVLTKVAFSSHSCHWRAA